MYTAVNAVGVKKGVNQRWQTIDITSITIANLYDIYRRVFLTLQTGTPAVTVYLDMDAVRSEYSTYDDTITQWLIDLMDASLPTSSTVPPIQTRTARFMDAFRAGYSIKPYNSIYGDNVSESDKLDALLTRSSPVSNYPVFHSTTLVSVNGFYHRTDTNGTNGIVVYKAAESAKKSNQNQMGLLTFEGMCSLEIVPFTQSMIYKQQENVPLSEAAYINTGLDLTNKNVLFIIGGYMHFVGDLVTQVGINTFKIDFSNYPIFDRFYEMKAHLNVSSFDLSSTEVNPNQISVEELQTDENIKALILMNQSFMVVLNTGHLYTDKNYVRATGYPGSYIAYTTPNKTLVTGLGRHNEYWYRQEDDQYILTVYDNAVSNRIYNTINPYFENSIGDSELPTDPVYLSGAYFLEIGRDE
jgi:hypothetical protein